MNNKELGKAIYDVLKTDLKFDDWYNQCFEACIEDAASLIDSGCCTVEKGSSCEISKLISKDVKTHNFDFEKENFIEFYGEDGFKNRFFPKE